MKRALATLLVAACAGCATAPEERSASPEPGPRAATVTAAPASAPATITVTAAPAPRPFDPAAEAAVVARAVADLRAEDVFARFGSQMQTALPLETLRPSLAAIRAQTGALDSLGAAQVGRGSGPRDAEVHLPGRFANPPNAFDYHIVFVDGRVEGLLVRPVEAGTGDPSRYDDYETKTRLSPPFEGTWTAHNAARARTNGHFGNRQQRFAVDWLIVGPDGRTHTGDGTRNEDYHCYGKTLIAPAPGTVVAAIDGVWDNVPGQMNGYWTVGNCVILDLEDGEYALFAHLIPGSVRVKPGQKVARGAPLGLCGNSGNSSEPHLHFQICDAPHFERSLSVPAKFTNVLLNGKRVEKAWPDEGDRLSSSGPF